MEDRVSESMPVQAEPVRMVDDAEEPVASVDRAERADELAERPERRQGQAFWRSLRDAVSVAVVAPDEPLRLLAVALLAGGHALVEDVPGTGKTLLARAAARALGLTTARIQGTPDLLPVDVTGGSVLDAGALRFVAGPVFTHILLVDEINRATPRTQSALLEAMQERQVSIEGETRPQPDPFLVVATQNPIEYEGTFALPEAQVDRFLVRLGIGYPLEADERRIARRYTGSATDPLDQVVPFTNATAVLDLRDRVRRLRVADEVEAYVVAIVAATRRHASLQLGGSPRATVALYRAAQAWAFLAGRDFVLPDDVQAVAPAVLIHRLIVDVDESIRGANAETALAEVLATVPVPPPA
jgi:MoxR-like ATPase